jgi:hypothetical protein
VEDFMRDDSNAKSKATELTRRNALLTGAGVVAGLGVLAEASPASAQQTSALAAKDVLKKEIELLDSLTEAAEGFTNSLAEQEVLVRAMGNHWANYFKGWRGIDKKLMDMPDDERDRELEREIGRLGRFSGQVTDDDGDAGKFYLESVFTADIKDAAGLIGSGSK